MNKEATIHIKSFIRGRFFELHPIKIKYKKDLVFCDDPQEHSQTLIIDSVVIELDTRKGLEIIKVLGENG